MVFIVVFLNEGPLEKTAFAEGLPFSNISSQINQSSKTGHKTSILILHLQTQILKLSNRF